MIIVQLAIAFAIIIAVGTLGAWVNDTFMEKPNED